MPIPKTRNELVHAVQQSYARLDETIDFAGPSAGNTLCVDDWTIKGLIAVRAWWTKNVIDWIEAGVRGESFSVPADGFTWKETPQLNARVVTRAKRKAYRTVISDLQHGYDRILPTIDSLTDAELLKTGQFVWTGKQPIARWISINTVRQYTTARTLIRRSLKRQA